MFGPAWPGERPARRVLREHVWSGCEARAAVDGVRSAGRCRNVNYVGVRVLRPGFWQLIYVRLAYLGSMRAIAY